MAEVKNKKRSSESFQVEAFQRVLAGGVLVVQIPYTIYRKYGLGKIIAEQHAKEEDIE